MPTHSATYPVILNKDKKICCAQLVFNGSSWCGVPDKTNILWWLNQEIEDENLEPKFISHAETLGERIKEYRIMKDYTQKELSLKAGLHFNTVYNIEKSNFKPNYAAIVYLAKALDIGLDDLFDGLYV